MYLQDGLNLFFHFFFAFFILVSFFFFILSECNSSLTFFFFFSIPPFVSSSSYLFLLSFPFPALSYYPFPYISFLSRPPFLTSFLPFLLFPLFLTFLIITDLFLFYHLIFFSSFSLSLPSSVFSFSNSFLPPYFISSSYIFSSSSFSVSFAPPSPSLTFLHPLLSYLPNF